MKSKSKPQFTATMPVYPTRKEPTILAAAMERLAAKDWVRLEGAPETERALERYHGGGHVWFIASGTASLEALLLGHQIGPGDEVISTPYTWGATISAILAVGAIPVFCDIDRRTGLLDPATVEALITQKTRAILTVHLFGMVADMVRLREIATRRRVLLLEDGSQAHGARLNGEPIGRGGDGSAFSCMGLKLLAGTEGGYALFNERAPLEIAQLYGQHPRGMQAGQVERLANSGLLDTLQLGWRPCSVSAELVHAKLPFLDREIAARRRNALQLKELLAGVATVIFPQETPQTAGAWHLLSLAIADGNGPAQRDAVIQRLAQTGVSAFAYIPVPIHRMKRLNPHDYHGPRVFWHAQLQRAGVDYRDTHCPQAEWRAANSFELAFNWTEDHPEAMQQLAECIAWATTDPAIFSET